MHITRDLAYVAKLKFLAPAQKKIECNQIV